MWFPQIDFIYQFTVLTWFPWDHQENISEDKAKIIGLNAGRINATSQRHRVPSEGIREVGQGPKAWPEWLWVGSSLAVTKISPMCLLEQMLWGIPQSGGFSSPGWDLTFEFVTSFFGSGPGLGETLSGALWMSILLANFLKPRVLPRLFCQHSRATPTGLWLTGLYNSQGVIIFSPKESCAKILELKGKS